MRNIYAKDKNFISGYCANRINGETPEMHQVVKLPESKEEDSQITTLLSLSRFCSY